MELDLALLSFDGVNAASEAFAAARDRSGAPGRWTSQVGLVEHHENGHLVLRGTFAGHYVDVDEALHVSERGGAEGAAVGAVIGTLLGGPLGLAVGTVTGATIGSQLGKPSEADAEPEPLAERLRAAVPRSGSAIVLIADARDVDEMLAATGEPGAQLIRKALTSEEAAAVQASLSASPAASPGPGPPPSAGARRWPIRRSDLEMFLSAGARTHVSPQRVEHTAEDQGDSPARGDAA
jgi:uncharacterized membrane protein